MIGLLVVFFPLALLAFMLFMERVEAPLRSDVIEGRQVEDFLDNARPAEMDTLVRFGIRRALDAMRSRRRGTPRVAAGSKSSRSS